MLLETIAWLMVEVKSTQGRQHEQLTGLQFMPYNRKRKTVQFVWLLIPERCLIPKR